jgi:hypothetical protein
MSDIHGPGHSPGQILPPRIATPAVPGQAAETAALRCTALPHTSACDPGRRSHDSSAAASSPASLFWGFKLGSRIISTNILTMANTAMAEMKVTRRLRPYASITVVRVNEGGCVGGGSGSGAIRNFQIDGWWYRNGRRGNDVGDERGLEFSRTYLVVGVWSQDRGWSGRICGP